MRTSVVPGRDLEWIASVSFIEKGITAVVGREAQHLGGYIRQ